jgi:hypothetical protein
MLSPASVNLALASVDHLYRQLGMDRANGRRDVGGQQERRTSLHRPAQGEEHWSWPTAPPGLISAVEEILPRADYQHCAVHRLDRGSGR